MKHTNGIESDPKYMAFMDRIDHEDERQSAIERKYDEICADADWMADIFADHDDFDPADLLNLAIAETIPPDKWDGLYIGHSEALDYSINGFPELLAISRQRVKDMADKMIQEAAEDAVDSP